MLLSPIQNGASFGLGGWKQTRPHLSQLFGKNPQIYAQFGLKGHNGIDYSGSKNSHDIFAPMQGKIIVKNDKGGYGLHVRIKDKTKEVVLGHFKSLSVIDGQEVALGEKLGRMGTSGFSTGVHLHLGLRFLKNGEVVNYDNGFAGYVDPVPYMITWKGTQDILNLA